MNLSEARIVLRARPLSETFDLAMRWTVAVRGPYLRLALVTLLPCWVVCVAARMWLQWDWIAVWALAAGLALLVQAPFTIAASQLMFSPTVRTRSVLREFLSRFGAFFVAMVLSRALVAVSALLIVLPPFAWTPVAFVPESILLEGHSVTQGLRRASNFNRGQTGTVLGLGFGLCTAMFGFVVGFDQVGFVLLDFTLQLGRPFESLWDDGGSATALLGFFAAVPYLATTRFLQYIDARTRRDGWDIQLAFLAIAATDEAREEAA